MLWKTLIASLCVIGVALAEQTPVFLWGANSVAKPSLRTVPQAEFAEQLATLLKDHMVVAFEENGLTNKDFLCSNSDAESCYARLQGVSPKTYYTSVENPTEALRAVATQREHNSINRDGQLASPVTCQEGTALFVTFDKAEQAREAALESHDAAIASITKQLKCKVAYLYMAAPSTGTTTLRRQRRDARETAATAGGTFWPYGNQFQLFYTALLLNGQAIPVTDMTLTNSSSSQFSVKLVTSDAAKSLTFDIVSTSDGYFTLQNLAYNSITYRTLGINAPTTFSYFCGNLTLNAADGSANKLQWNSVQFQAPFSAATKDKFPFGDPWHCVGFFTPGILMGLLVVVLLLVIVFVAICWMMDINTMDRFDDPKGKTITINASAD